MQSQSLALGLRHSFKQLGPSTSHDTNSMHIHMAVSVSLFLSFFLLLLLFFFFFFFFVQGRINSLA